MSPERAAADACNNRIVRRAIFAVLITIFAVKASACSCTGEMTVGEALEHADAVFAGVVTSIEDLPGHERKVTFRVMQWWKSDAVTESIELRTGMGGGDCGYPVEIGKSFLVHARRDSRNQLWFGICDRTAALICASADLEELGQPFKTYETFDTASLVKREQPYTTYWRTCIEPPALISERGLNMNKHCRFQVEGVIDRDGAVRDFRIVNAPADPLARICPDSLQQQITEQVAKWRFRPAMFNGQPVETLLTSISMREPR